MESPVRKMQKRNDYNRHKLFRKIKRRRKAAAEQQSKAAEKELKRRLKWTAPKFDDGKDQYNFYPSAFDANGNLKPELTVTTPAVDVTGKRKRADGITQYYNLQRQMQLDDLLRRHSEIQPGTGQITSGNGALEIVSPEFDVLMLGRGFFNDGLFRSFKIPQNRIQYQGNALTLEDALQNLSDDEFRNIVKVGKDFFTAGNRWKTDNKFVKLFDSRYKQYLLNNSKTNVTNTVESQEARNSIKNFLNSDEYRKRFDAAEQWRNEADNQILLLDNTPTYTYEVPQKGLYGYYTQANGGSINVDNTLRNGGWPYYNLRRGAFKHETGHAASGAGDNLSVTTLKHNRAIKPTVRDDVGLTKDQIEYLSQDDEIRTRFLNVASDMIEQGKSPMDIFDNPPTKFPNSDYFDVLQNYERASAKNYMQNFRSYFPYMIPAFALHKIQNK